MIEGMHFPLVIRNATSESLDLDNAVSVMDEDEFRAFYERTARPLWAYLSRVAASVHDADDILQETYYRFYRAGTRHNDEAHRRNSLFLIATNLIRDAARRAKHHDDVPLDEAPLLTSAAHGQPAVPERHALMRTDLARGMQRLEPVQRELLWLAYAQGASHEEIATILGLREVSIRTLLLRARRKLAAILSSATRNDSEEPRR
jgi:RNA polymerase sigma-70 factor (ECF subfamily)